MKLSVITCVPLFIEIKQLMYSKFYVFENLSGSAILHLVVRKNCTEVGRSLPRSFRVMFLNILLLG